MDFILEFGKFDVFCDVYVFICRIENVDGSIDIIIYISCVGYVLLDLVVN